MDFSGATSKISDVIITVNEYVDKIMALRDKYIKKINKCLEDLETTINTAIDAVKNGVESALVWLDIKIKKIMKYIQDIIDKLTEKIQSIINQLKTWYDTTINSIKRNVIIAVFAKIGQPLKPNEADMFCSLIPHPSIDTLLPSFEIELSFELPDLSNLVSINYVTLPRL